MDCVSLQQYLPCGLQLERLIVDEGLAGTRFVALDARLNPERPLSRNLRLIRLRPDDEWTPKLISRLGKLAAREWRHIARPFEIGQISEVGLYLLSSNYPTTLDTCLPPAGLLAQNDAWRRFRQLAEGLAELHDHDIDGCDLRPQNIFVNTTQLGPMTELRIGNSELGLLPVWTKNQVFSNASIPYTPREPHRSSSQPGKPADTYALGVIGCELLLGSASVHLALLSSETSSEAWEKLNRSLRSRGVSGVRQRILKQILAPAANSTPIQDGRTLVNALDREPSWFGDRRVISVLLLAVVVLAVVVTQRRGAAIELADAQTQFRTELQLLETRKENEKRFLRSAIENEENKVRLLKVELDGLKERVPSPVPPVLRPKPTPIKPDYQLAREFWQELPPDTPLPKIIAEIQKRKLATPVAKLVQSYVELVKSAAEGLYAVSKKRETYLKDVSWRRFRAEPWAENRQTELANWAWHQLIWNVPLDSVAFGEGIQKPIGGVPLASSLRRALSGWSKETIVRQRHWRRWFTAEQQALFVNPMKASLNEPWNAALLTEANSAYSTLRQAEEIWREKARTCTGTWSEFCAELVHAGTAHSNPKVIKALSHWVSRFNDSDPARYLQLTIAIGPRGNGTYRVLELRSANTLYTRVSGDWYSEIWHDYRTVTSGDVQWCSWKPGQPLRCLLYGPRSSYYGVRSTLVDLTIDGPIGLWKLADQGISKGGFAIDVEVKSCPGPPRQSSILPKHMLNR